MMTVSQLIWDKERDVIVSWCQESLLQLQPGTFWRFQPEQLVVLIRVLAEATDQDDSAVMLNQDGAAGMMALLLLMLNPPATTTTPSG